MQCDAENIYNLLKIEISNKCCSFKLQFWQKWFNLDTIKILSSVLNLHRMSSEDHVMLWTGVMSAETSALDHRIFFF